MIRSFREAAQLSNVELRALLRAGEPQEQLWAVWALAASLGRGSIPSLLDLSASDISEGMKRHLLVVLAGLGERELIERAADSESSTTVRATATRLFIRTCTDKASANAWAQTKAQDPSSEVGEVLLAEHEAGVVELEQRMLLGFARSEQYRLRKQALRLLLVSELDPPHTIELLEAVAAEPDVGLRRNAIAELPRGRLLRLAELALRRRPEVAAHALETVRSHSGKLTWQEAAPYLASRHACVLKALVCLLPSQLPSTAVPWLATAFRVLADGSLDRADFRLHFALRKSLNTSNVADLDDESAAFLEKVTRDMLSDYEPHNHWDECVLEPEEQAEIATLNHVLDVLSKR